MPHGDAHAAVRPRDCGHQMARWAWTGRWAKRLSSDRVSWGRCALCPSGSWPRWCSSPMQPSCGHFAVVSTGPMRHSVYTMIASNRLAAGEAWGFQHLLHPLYILTGESVLAFRILRLVGYVLLSLALVWCARAVLSRIRISIPRSGWVFILLLAPSGDVPCLELSAAVHRLQRARVMARSARCRAHPGLAGLGGVLAARSPSVMGALASMGGTRWPDGSCSCSPR